MYERLISFGIGKSGQRILDLGSGTAVLPVNLAHTGADFTATDISENQINYGKALVKAKGLDNISFKVCSAEKTGFADSSFDVVTAVQCFHYFNAEKAADEIRRVLKPDGLFCKIFMDWLPYEDSVIAEMESLVLKYNPEWNGCGFKEYKFIFPDWAENRFDIENVCSYNAELEFTKEAWLGRIMSCQKSAQPAGHRIDSVTQTIESLAQLHPENSAQETIRGKQCHRCNLCKTADQNEWKN